MSGRTTTVRPHDLFISYAVVPDAPTFNSLRDAYLMLSHDVFNPDIDRILNS